ncbi:MAG: hypothetical protein N3B13_06315, partial [Deltaproteobacteria bacterium]|nr:hypothetical protein [Deltaproteobacteria bacterium]
MGRKILIFGNFPFNERNEFIDTNHFATYFARRGDEVDFVTPPAYVADFFLPFFDKRLRVLRNFFKSSVTVEDNLYQHTILSFLPVRNNFFLGSNINMSLFSAGFRVSHISKKEYDICITSQGFMLLWTQYVKSGIFIYRYNDILDGFSSNPSALNLCENNFIRQKAPLVLAVNKRLAQYLSDKYPDYTKIEILPNGVDTELFENAEPDAEIMKIHKKKMVFCGGIDFWVDTGLLYETARQLSDSVLIPVS